MSDRQNVYLFYRHDPQLTKKATQLSELAEKNGFNIVENHQEANIIISIGGDGIFLQSVRKTGFRNDCLYIGLATKENLGMYCDFHIDEISEMIAAITEENIKVRKYPTIKVNVDGEGTFYCLNEFSIRSGIIKTFALDVYIDDLHFETFCGDGMLIATPTGSTAYNKSVKGAVVDPLLPCLQVSEIASLNNNQFRTLDSSFILSGDRKLIFHVIQDGNDYPTMAMDNEALSIQHVKKVEVQLSGEVIKTVKLKNNSFWHKVKRSFL